ARNGRAAGQRAATRRAANAAVRTRGGDGGAGLPWGPRRGRRGRGVRGWGSRGPAGSAFDPPSSSEESGASRACIASSLRNGIHSIRPAIGIFTSAASISTQTQSGICDRWYYCAMPRDSLGALAALEREVTACRRCPRLVAWREEVAREKRAAFADE